MECPNCHNKGNVLKRIFSKRKGSKTHFCTYCNAEVKLSYNWKKIFLLAIILLAILLALNYILLAIGWGGVSGGMAGGAIGATLAVYMGRPPFLKIELVKKKKK